MNSKLIRITSTLGLFLLVTGVSYLAFDRFVPASSSPSSSVDQDGTTPEGSQKTGFITFEGPKTQACPLNGQLYTKEEEAIWQTRRPLTVMIENHADSRPQSGLSNADIVYEAIAEGGITRFMGVFYCQALRGSPNKYDVGPVRSARTYFLDLASEYSDYPLYAHVGGANCSAPMDPATGRQSGPCTTDPRARAIEQISDYGWMQKGTWGDLSQFSLPYKVCRREPDRVGEERATEHTMYCSTSELWNVAAARGLTNETEIKGTSWDKNFTPWSFTAADKPAATIDAPAISFDFWSGYKDYSVSWKYDSASNSYVRSNGGQPHLDFNTSEAITAKNIIIQFTKETRAVDEHLHNLYQVVGRGEGILIQNGTKIDITWSKPSRTARTIFKDKTGKEISFVPGTIWIEILPLNSAVDYETQ